MRCWVRGLLCHQQCSCFMTTYNETGFVSNLARTALHLGRILFHLSVDLTCWYGRTCVKILEEFGKMDSPHVWKMSIMQLSDAINVLSLLLLAKILLVSMNLMFSAANCTMYMALTCSPSAMIIFGFVYSPICRR